MPLADTHCHLTSKEYEKDIEKVIERAEKYRLSRLLVIGSDLKSSINAVKLAVKRRAQGIFASVGIHPHDSGSFHEALPRELYDLASSEAVVAIGETGLDYHYDHSERHIQRASFERHIQLAINTKKPLIVHVREAYDDSINILKNFKLDSIGGVIHSFSGSWNDACAILDLGFHISFSGMLTFKKNDELRDTASRLPLDRILCETDSPWLSPHPYRGKRNEPSHVRFVYEVLADCRTEEYDVVEKQVWDNALRLFRWERQ